MEKKTFVSFRLFKSKLRQGILTKFKTLTCKFICKSKTKTLCNLFLFRNFGELFFVENKLACQTQNEP